MERMRYIRVPKDIKAMEDYEYGVQKDEQMEELILSESQYGVFYNLKVDRKSTRLNSSHLVISYAVFCLKKKRKKKK